MATEPIELTAADGLVLRGERWGEGRDWLVLLHDAGQDLDSWRPVELLADEREEWSVLALDLRGHGGSENPWDADAIVLDAEAAIAYARARDAGFVCAVGAGAGALAALAACDGSEAPDALALFSPGPLDESRARELRGAGVPKLIFVGALKSEAAAGTAALRAASIGQWLVVSFPTDVQGTDLVEGIWAVQALEHLASFFDEQRHGVGAPATPLPMPPGVEAILREEG